MIQGRQTVWTASLFLINAKVIENVPMVHVYRNDIIIMKVTLNGMVLWKRCDKNKAACVNVLPIDWKKLLNADDSL